MTTGDEKAPNASRQERYLKAVELLSSAHSYTRLGAVHTLVTLADEYLADKSLSTEERSTEGQRIVDVLCAYIRSPFKLAFRYDELSQDKPSPHGVYRENHQEFSLHRAELLAEAKVRQQALQEFHRRLRHFPQGDRRSYVEGSWSGFEYDFSNSVFFYPVDMKDSWYQNSVDFSGCTYYASAEFSGSTYERSAYFCDSTYYDWVFFNNSTYLVKPSGAGLRTIIRRVSTGLFTMVRFPSTILFTVDRSSSTSLSTTMRLYSIALPIGARPGSTARCTEAQFL